MQFMLSGENSRSKETKLRCKYQCYSYRKNVTGALSRVSEADRGFRKRDSSIKSTSVITNKDFFGMHYSMRERKVLVLLDRLHLSNKRVKCVTIRQINLIKLTASTWMACILDGLVPWTRKSAVFFS